MESRNADAGHTVGDGEGCQSTAAMESRNADAGHTVGDGEGCQSAAIIVFATYCVSAIFTLNGRKVMSTILEMMKKMKI